MSLVVRLLLTAAALWLAAAIVPGIDVFGDSLGYRVLSLALAAVVFTAVNAIVKPVVMLVGCALYVLTLGLFALVVNALMFWLTGWLSERLDLGFSVDGFWAAFWGAIIVAVAMWVMDLLTPRAADRGD